MTKDPTRLHVVVWSIGVTLTGVWVIFYVGFLTLAGLTGGNYDLGTRRYAYLLVVSAIWAIAIVATLTMRSRRGLWISTLPLIFVATCAVIFTFFPFAFSRLGPLP
ncbi:MAG: hypothetical protein ABI632_07155 [Pseudolysinimonas sp.]